MHSNKHRIKVGIVGCGAIGSRIAKSIRLELKRDYELAGLYDAVKIKSVNLESALKSKGIVKNSFPELLKSCHLMVEAINVSDTQPLIQKALSLKKHVLAMSVGRLLNAKSLFQLAQRNSCYLLMPSGAIAGIDALKAVSKTPLQHVWLTTRKPLTGFGDNPYFKEKNIVLSNIRSETILFEGNVESAVKYFPQNINVAATLALAVQANDKITIRIITSPDFKTNSHEIEAVGDFGRLITRTENVVCPDNPKTSYLAVLSAIETLRGFCQFTKIGT